MNYMLVFYEYKKLKTMGNEGSSSGGGWGYVSACGNGANIGLISGSIAGGVTGLVVGEVVLCLV